MANGQVLWVHPWRTGHAAKVGWLVGRFPGCLVVVRIVTVFTMAVPDTGFGETDGACLCANFATCNMNRDVKPAAWSRRGRRLLRRSCRRVQRQLRAGAAWVLATGGLPQLKLFIV